jgi:hypothetical protein
LVIACGRYRDKKALAKCMPGMYGLELAKGKEI